MTLEQQEQPRQASTDLSFTALAPHGCNHQAGRYQGRSTSLPKSLLIKVCRCRISQQLLTSSCSQREGLSQTQSPAHGCHRAFPAYLGGSGAG